jgi:hypothetical protein
MRDPRVRRRFRGVLEWALPRVPFPGPFEFMAKDLRKVFGNSSNNALARWLLANVLQQTGFYQVGGFPFAYFIRPEGLEKLLALLAEADAAEAAQNATGRRSHNI